MNLDHQKRRVEQQLSTVGDAKASNNCQLTTVQVDRLVSAVSDLTTPEFHDWYCKQAYKLGGERFLAVADTARRGNSPARLFSALLKRT